MDLVEVNRSPTRGVPAVDGHPWRKNWLALSTGTIPLIGKLPHTLCLLSTHRRKNLAILANLTPTHPIESPKLPIFTNVRHFRPDSTGREPAGVYDP